ncbi:MAG: hypothetical protein KJ767_00255 [Nanoarchaeota archaeon]|nr:hypothetical protein [Nanoarchaeota archaeon]
MAEETKTQKQETNMQEQEETAEEQQEQEKPQQKQEVQEEKTQPEKEQKFEGILENIERNKNPILDREDVSVLVKSNRTPTNNEAKKLLASELKIKEELVVITHVYSFYGAQEFNIRAHVYTNKETLQKLEFKKEKKVAVEGEQ